MKETLKEIAAAVSKAAETGETPTDEDGASSSDTPEVDGSKDAEAAEDQGQSFGSILYGPVTILFECNLICLSHILLL